jgi:hypothetical protein
MNVNGWKICLSYINEIDSVRALQASALRLRPSSLVVPEVCHASLSELNSSPSLWYTLSRHAVTIGYDKGKLCFTPSDKEMLTWLVFLHWLIGLVCFQLMSSAWAKPQQHSGDSGWNAQVITSHKSKNPQNPHPRWCQRLHGLPPTVKPYSNTIRWQNVSEKMMNNYERWRWWKMLMMMMMMQDNDER